MSKDNIELRNIIIWIVLGFIIGLLTYKVMSDSAFEKAQKEKEELVEKLKDASNQIENLKQGLASEREIFQEEISKSEVRYDSLERVYRVRERRLRGELDRIKKLTIKELQHEADSIYNANVHLRDSLGSD